MCHQVSFYDEVGVAAREAYIGNAKRDKHIGASISCLVAVSLTAKFTFIFHSMKQIAPEPLAILFLHFSRVDKYGMVLLMCLKTFN